jgi:hypothetical protein
MGKESFRVHPEPTAGSAHKIRVCDKLESVRERGLESIEFLLAFNFEMNLWMDQWPRYSDLCVAPPCYNCGYRRNRSCSSACPGPSPPSTAPASPLPSFPASLSRHPRTEPVAQPSHAHTTHLPKHQSAVVVSELAVAGMSEQPAVNNALKSKIVPPSINHSHRSRSRS